MSIEPEFDINTLKVAKVKSLRSSLFFTRYFFKHQYNRKFVIGDHHVKISEKLDAVLRGEITRLIINIAPRYGKTELAVKNFIAKGLAHNPAAKFIHLSYSDDLALDNSEGVKDIVNLSAYQEMFPNVRIKKGSDSKKKWYTTEGGGVYATAAGGQVTGFGAGRVDDPDRDEQEFGNYVDDFVKQIDFLSGFGGALIIDDPIKPDDAESELARERVNNRFDSTIINRVNSRKTPIIIIMQRLHEKDLCGHVMENYPGEWEVLSLPCIIVEENQSLQEGKALWEFKHTLNELLAMNNINPINFGRQYMQNPQPKEGLMYLPFRTYKEIPATGRRKRKNYTDTADEGKDYLCSISYEETELGCYVLDVIYTTDAMENTEVTVAKSLTRFNVQLAEIESNNGGKGFARNVEKEVRAMKNTQTRIHWFHQSANKDSRIFNKRIDVTNLVFFPANWKELWPLFYTHVTSYSAKGKNAHDDAADALTGVAENFGKSMTGDLGALAGLH